MSDETMSLRDALGEAYDAVSAEPAATTAPLPASEATSSPASEAATQEASRPTAPKAPRGPGGKFTKTVQADDSAEAEEVEEGADKTEPAATDEAKAANGTPDKTATKPPASWTAEAKSLWEGMDPLLRKEVLRREADTQRLVQTFASARKQNEQLDAVLAPRADVLASQYGDVPTALKTLFALSDFATKDPAGFVQYFAQQRGLDLASLTHQTQAAPSMSPGGVDPQIAALQRQVQDLTGFVQRQQQQAAETTQGEVSRLYEQFRSDPANKYLADVSEDMARLLEGGLASDYQDAYDKACWARPDIRETMLAEASREAEAKRLKEAESRAKEARRVSTMNIASKSVAGSSPANAAMSLRDSMERIYDAVNSRTA